MTRIFLLGRIFGWIFVGSKKTNKHKTHKHFSDGPCGTIVPGTNPHPSQGQTGQNGDFTAELNRERPVCPRDGSHFVPGTGPVCPRDSSCLSRTPSRRKCLCLLVFFFPDFWRQTKPWPSIQRQSRRRAWDEIRNRCGHSALFLLGFFGGGQTCNN